MIAGISKGICVPALVILLFANAGFPQAGTRSVTGKYRNPALGYSIEVPSGLKGIAGEQAGPERGITIVLPSGGTLSVFAEPNSLEWKNPAEAVRYDLSHTKCAGKQDEISPARIGKIAGAKGRLVCDDRVVIALVALRPKGGPVYWLHLETAPKSESADSAVLTDVAATFKLIRWQ